MAYNSLKLMKKKKIKTNKLQSLQHLVLPGTDWAHGCLTLAITQELVFLHTLRVNLLYIFLYESSNAGLD